LNVCGGAIGDTIRRMEIGDPGKTGDPSSPAVQAMLDEARVKARRLVEKLKEQEVELDAHPPELPLDKLLEGRQAMRKAVESAERMLANLEAATAISRVPFN
jgi:hypothetical protein